MHVTFIFSVNLKEVYSFVQSVGGHVISTSMDDFVEREANYYFENSTHSKFFIALPASDLKGPYAEKFYEHLRFYQQAGVSMDFIAAINLSHNIPS